MATLIKESLIVKITPKNGKMFSFPELYSYVGVSFYMHPLMSGDVLLTEKDFKNQALGRNDLASILTHMEIHGKAMICTPEELN